MNIFITGATGFIGSRLVKSLDRPENNIRILSRRLHPNYETVICDLESEIIPFSSLDSIDVVFHVAGYAHDLKNNSIEHPYQKINVDATTRLAMIAIKSKIKQFVYISSVKAGGEGSIGCCLTEENQIEPRGIYGKSKRNAELTLLQLFKESDIGLTIIRPSLVYGPEAKGNLKLMMRGIQAGWFPPLPETGNRRSMIHIDNLIRAILFLSEDIRSNGEIFIATDAENYSSREIYDTMRILLGKKVCKWHVPKFLFLILSSVNSSLKYKIDKLLGDDCYSSQKLKSLGFKATRSLKEMNETSF